MPIINEILRQTTKVNFAKELWLLLQIPKHSNLTYQEVLPPHLVQSIEDRIGIFGFTDLLAVPESYKMDRDGLYFIRPKNSGNYDCISSSLDISDALAENRDAIPDYLSHGIRQGYDKRGINTQHFWVELLIKNGWTAESITIDMTPPYKGENPEHLTFNNIPRIRRSTIVKLDNRMIYSAHWEDSSSQNTFVSTMGINNEDGKTFAQYAVDIIPKDASKDVTRYELWINLDSSEMIPFKATIKGIKHTARGYGLDFEEKPASINEVFRLIIPKDKAALHAMIQAYSGIEPNLNNPDDLYTRDFPR